VVYIQNTQWRSLQFIKFNFSVKWQTLLWVNMAENRKFPANFSKSLTFRIKESLSRDLIHLIKRKTFSFIICTGPTDLYRLPNSEMKRVPGFELKVLPSSKLRP
jgi:hypothetical protein